MELIWGLAVKSMSGLAGGTRVSLFYFLPTRCLVYLLSTGAVTFSYYLTGAHSDFHLAVLCATGHLLDVAPSIPDVIVTSELR